MSTTALASVSGLVNYYRMRVLLAECCRVDEAKKILDQAEALRVYAHLASDFEAEEQLLEIRWRSEINLGRLLREKRERGERLGGWGGDRRSTSAKELDLLSKFNISPKQSFQCQRLEKELPKDLIESSIAAGTYASLRARTINQTVAVQVKESWRGMPPCDQEDQQDPFGGVYVRFQEADARAKFADLIGQDITEKTKTVNFPEIEDTPCTDRVWVGAPSAEATA